MFDQLAEQKIAEAMERGEFDDLPGMGKPLDLDDDAHIPEELRVACRILKNAGFVPPEVETLNEVAELERLIARQDLDAAHYSRAVRKLALLKTTVEARYYRKAMEKLGR